jgi:myosin heavy subunit
MLRWLLVSIVAASLAAGCKGKDKGGTAAAPGPSAAAKKEQADLLARRDALLKSRQQIRDEQAKVEAQRQAIKQQGGDTSELDKKAQELASQDDKLAADEGQLLDAFERKLTELEAVRAGGNDKAVQVAAREAGMASREKGVASREDRVAQREAQLAARERQLAVREHETCSQAPAPTIIQAAEPKGSKYRKRDVEPLLKRARSAMAHKGILADDLPAPAQGLEREATKAMADADYGAAYFAARQLSSTVASLRVDRAFIAAKINRLSARMKGHALDAGKQKRVDQLFSEATGKYGDGNFGSANHKLNQIYALVQ